MSTHRIREVGYIRADRYIRELVERQTQDHEGVGFAVKSLCNIGQRCAEMFRTDFEQSCLRTALNLDPTDSWLLIQNADHLKRIGNYVEAIRLAQMAQRSGAGDVGTSLIADIHAQMGDFDDAIAIYKSIPDWDLDDHVLVAIADNLRRKGELSRAREWYERVLSAAIGNDRAIAGLAEIARQEGRLNDAEEMYRQLASNREIDDHTRWFYSVVLAENIKAAGRFEAAYSLVESVLTEAPFFMRARVLRASLLGLMNKAEEALSQLPEARSHAALGEWVTAYTRGLLLLLTKDYQTARTEMLKSLNQSVLREDEATIVRLACALSSIAANDLVEARATLANAAQVRNTQAHYLESVLKFHVAIVENDSKAAAKLRTHLQTLSEKVTLNLHLPEIVQLLERRDIARAIQLEIVAMLQLVA